MREHTITSVSVYPLSGTDSLQVNVEPALALRSHRIGVLLIDQFALKAGSPLVLVKPSLNGVDCLGAYFRLDLGKGDKFLIDKPPAPLNSHALSLIFRCAHAAYKMAINKSFEPHSAMGMAPQN